MAVKFVLRPSDERGHADHGWLKTFHTFSFAMYQDYNHMQFGSLRVINEDRVQPGTGFGMHSHREFEIFSYIVSGELEHHDSMGNVEVLKRGDIQLTSAGSPGISHSETCHGPKPVHFLQIWALPRKSRLPAKYFTRRLTDEEKQDKWARVVAPVGTEGVEESREGKGSAPVQSPVFLYSTILSPGKSLTHTLPQELVASAPAEFREQRKSIDNERKAYVHVIQTSGYNPKKATGASIKLSGTAGTSVTLREGDGVYIFGEKGSDLSLENVGEKAAEVLLFDIE